MLARDILSASATGSLDLCLAEVSAVPRQDVYCLGLVVFLSVVLDVLSLPAVFLICS